jgi:hypothetical protein
VAKDRTFTFRATSDLGERLGAVRTVFDTPDDDDVDVGRLVAREFERRLYRARKTGLALESQSEVLRLAIELVVGSCEKVADDLYWAELYAQEPPREEENEEWLAAIFTAIERRSVA